MELALIGETATVKVEVHVQPDGALTVTEYDADSTGATMIVVVPWPPMIASDGDQVIVLPASAPISASRAVSAAQISVSPSSAMLPRDMTTDTLSLAGHPSLVVAWT
jgi:hypothetical protein